MQQGSPRWRRGAALGLLCAAHPGCVCLELLRLRLHEGCKNQLGLVLELLLIGRPNRQGMSGMSVMVPFTPRKKQICKGAKGAGAGGRSNRLPLPCRG